ncbi:MAG: winged helix-turn-helix domain-containing protein [Nanoarchaeota archaeon]
MTDSSFKLYKNFFKTISNDTRFEIIKFLIKGSKSVNNISKTLKFEQSRVSHNLKILECYKFINCECKGKERIYSINKKSYIIEIIRNINKYVERYNKMLEECSKNKKLK